MLDDLEKQKIYKYIKGLEDLIAINSEEIRYLKERLNELDPNR